MVTRPKGIIEVHTILLSKGRVVVRPQRNGRRGGQRNRLACLTDGWRGRGFRVAHGSKVAGERTGLREMRVCRSIGRHQGQVVNMGRGLSKMVAFLKLGSPSGVAFPVPDTEILAHKGTVAIGEITAVYLFGGI